MIFRLGLLSVLLIALTGCVGLGGPDRSASPPPLPSPLPKAVHPPAAKPVDRDQARVLAALAQVDACALLDPAKAKAPGFTVGATIRRTDPHECRIEHSTAWVRAELGLADSFRFHSELRTLAGAKAYVKGDEDSCQVTLPVTFQRSVSFYGHWPDKAAPLDCRTVEAFAAAAVPVLNRPAPTKAPLASWNGCTALEKLVGRATGRFEVGSYPTLTVDGCTDWVDGRKGTEVSLGYGPDLVPSNHPKTVRLAGRTAGVTYGEGQCWLTWNQGPSAQPDPREKWVQIVLRSPNCATSKRLAVKLIAMLAGPLPAAAKPQAPLLMKPTDHDSKQPGACIDLEVTKEFPVCEPYVPVQPPKGAVEVYRQGSQDGNVVCSISQDAVRRVLGSGFRPVVEGAACVFVEPSHALEVRVGVTDRTVVAGIAPRKVELAGRKALVSTSQSDEDNKLVYLRAEDSTGVVLSVHFAFERPRGGGDLDTGREAQLEPLGRQILEQSF
ncbi:hypothetical protein AB0H36_12985 [Kribbella sp. NPDC050820]|uniref:hypothetical protein n=1 Tax=Kribbella sp. NPDC050820 TaxID=3155408 RepID=UPI003406300D